MSTTDDSLRVVIADDSVLLREGLARLLAEDGFDVVGQAGDAEDLLRKVGAHRPDVAVVDVRMPPTHTDEGLRAALEIRARLPQVAIVLLSHHVQRRYATELLERDEGSGGKTKGSSGAGSYQPGGGFPSLKVSPDVNALPGLPNANEGINGLAAAALIVLLAAGVVGVLTLALSSVVQLPRWAEQGKIGIIIAPVGAFVLSLLGQLVGWGWSLGIG